MYIVDRQCDRESDDSPCKRCSSKKRVCGASYLSRNDPKRITKPKIVVLKDPKDIAEWEQLQRQKDILAVVDVPAVLPPVEFNLPNHRAFEELLPPTVGLNDSEMQLFGLPVDDSWLGVMHII